MVSVGEEGGIRKVKKKQKQKDGMGINTRGGYICKKKRKKKDAAMARFGRWKAHGTNGKRRGEGGEIEHFRPGFWFG